MSSPNEGVFDREESVHLDPIKPSVDLVVSDIAGNISRQMVPIELPPLDLGPAANDAERVYGFLLRRGVPKENMTLLVSTEDHQDVTRARSRRP